MTYEELKPYTQSSQYHLHLSPSRLHDVLNRDHRIDTSNTRTPIEAINIKCPRNTYSTKFGYSRPDGHPLVFASLFSLFVSSDDFLVTDPLLGILVTNTNNSSAIILSRKEIS